MRYRMTREPFADDAASQRHQSRPGLHRLSVVAIASCLLCLAWPFAHIAHADGLPSEITAEHATAEGTDAVAVPTDPNEDEVTVSEGQPAPDEPPVPEEELAPSEKESPEPQAPTASDPKAQSSDAAGSADTAPPQTVSAPAASQAGQGLVPYLLMGGGAAALALIGVATLLERRRDVAGGRPYRRRRHYA